MTIEDLLNFCKGLKGFTTIINQEDHLCTLPCSASLKVSEEDFVILTTTEGLNHARYFAKRH